MVSAAVTAQLAALAADADGAREAAALAASAIAAAALKRREAANLARTPQKLRPPAAPETPPPAAALAKPPEKPSAVDERPVVPPPPHEAADGPESAAALAARGNDPHLATLFAAARDGDAWRASSLLAARTVDVNGGVATADGRTAAPVHAAAEAGHADVVAVLVGATGGCDVDVRDSRRDAPAHLAARGGHVAALEALLRAGAAYKGQRQGGKMLWTPSHEAAAADQDKALAALANAGCDVARALLAKRNPPPPTKKPPPRGARGATR